MCRDPAEKLTWLASYADEVQNAFSSRFGAAPDRFRAGQQLLDRFRKAVDLVLGGGGTSFSAVDEAHNELCIAEALITNSAPRFMRIDYEPRLPNCDKTIDFRAETQDGLAVYVDVKTIRPISKDRWDQFEEAVRKERFPKNVAYLLDQEWLGGELWHSAFAARGRMLEYTLELEQKIALSGSAGSNCRFVLAFCGEGFYWHHDELEDFASFYFSGAHRSDDPFGLMEASYLQAKVVTLSKAVSQLAALTRAHGAILHEKLNWNVQAPIDPAFY